MSKPTPARLPIAIAAVAVALLCLPATSGAGASNPSAGAAGPARAAVKNCGSVETRNGGRAAYIATVRAKCRTGRRVARRATGRRYRALGFSCKLSRRRPAIRGKLYSCGRLHNGVGQGIGFIYRAP